jgi:DNA-binding response OmpR family regulator
VTSDEERSLSINLLVVSSDQETAAELSRGLRDEGMSASMFLDGDQALRSLEQASPDAVIVSLDQAGDWPLELCGQIRERTQVPLLVVGDREREQALRRSLDLGADAQIVRPFAPGFLVAQLYAVLRRAGLARPGVGSKYDIGTLAIDLFTREVRVRGRVVELTPTEFEIVRCLLSNSGRALSYRTLVRQVQGYDCSPEEARRLLKVHIHNLRRKVEPIPEKPAHILNVRGFGYLFERRRSPRDGSGEPVPQVS